MEYTCTHYDDRSERGCTVEYIGIDEGGNEAECPLCKAEARVAELEDEIARITAPVEAGGGVAADLRVRVADLERVIAHYQDGDQYHAHIAERELGIEDLSFTLGEEW